MDMSELKELIKLFETSSVTEMEYERGGLRVRLKPQIERGTTGGATAAAETDSAATELRSEVDTATAEEMSERHSISPDLVTINAPMVGIFYSAPAPDAKPFVVVGQSIEDGQTVGIISAMKVMNEIKTEIVGTIRDILVENGQAIEYGQPLFAVEPAQ